MTSKDMFRKVDSRLLCHMKTIIKCRTVLSLGEAANEREGNTGRPASCKFSPDKQLLSIFQGCGLAEARVRIFEYAVSSEFLPPHQQWQAACGLPSTQPLWLG